MSTSLQLLQSALFPGLAHSIGIRRLEQLVLDERPVREFPLAFDQPILSQHLATLRTPSVVAARRVWGPQARYTLASPLTPAVRRLSRESFTWQFSESQSMLRELREARRG